MPPRRIHRIVFQIDTNRINSRGGEKNMNILERWYENEVIHLEMSEPALGEVLRESNAARKGKAANYVYSLTLAETDEEKKALRRIEEILFPNGAQDQNQKNDVAIVFNAKKYSRTLVTNDGGSKSQRGGILGNAEQLRKELGVRVITDATAVEIVHEEIRRRDELARRVSEKYGVPLPDWVGKD
jgi:hypothetical protein